MNTATFFRKYAVLMSLAIVLIVAFLLKNTPDPDRNAALSLTAAPSESVTAPSTAAPANETNRELDAKPGTATRRVSIASVAARISQAFEASMSPKVEPLPDFSSMADVKTKKAAFFNYLEVLARTANAKIVQLRAEIQRMHPQRLTTQQLKRLNRLSKSYKVKTKIPTEQINLLLRKIDMIPQALVLAQAANESAWGTSRFATQGNNLFGQWCFSSGCGLTPSDRPEGAKYEVRKFEDPQASVDSYIRNLNSHASYRGLRGIRECLINNAETVSARALSTGLKSYSSRGVDYIDDIRSIIRTNKLEPWVKPWWGNGNQHPCSELVQLIRPK